MLPNQFTNAAPRAARATGSAPKAVTSLACLVARSIPNAAASSQARQPESAVSSPALSGTHSSSNSYTAVVIDRYSYWAGLIDRTEATRDCTSVRSLPHPQRLAGVLNSFGRLQAARNLLSRVKGFAEPLRRFCERLVFSPAVRVHRLLFPVSAARCGLVAAVYGHHSGEREMKCPTRNLKDLTK